VSQNGRSVLVVMHRLRDWIASRRAERRAIAEYRSAWRQLARVRRPDRAPVD